MPGIGDEYVVPFGVDAAPFLKGIAEMETGTDELIASAEDANKKLQISFDNSGGSAKRAAAAAAEYQAQLDLNAKSAQSYFVLAERLRILNEALFTESDKGRIKAYQQEIEKTKTSIQQLQNIGKVGFDSMGVALQRQVGIMEQLQQKAALYKLAIQQASDPTRIAGLNKVLEQTNKEMTMLSNAGKTGFDSLGNALAKTTVEVEKTAKSTNFLRSSFGSLRQLAFILPGIGLAGIFNIIGESIIEIVKSTGLLAANFDAIGAKTKLLTTVNQEANKQAGKQLTDLKFLYDATQDVTRSTKERTDALVALKAEFPDAFKGISDETILNGGAKKSYDDLTTAILNTARATAAKTELDKIAGELLDLEFKKQKIRNAGAQELLNARAVVNPVNASGIVAGLAPSNTAQITLADQKAIIQARTDGALKQVDINEQQLKDQEKFLIAFAGGEKAITTVIETADLKKEAELKRHNDAAAKLRAEELKNFNNLLSKFASQDAELQAKAIDDSEQSQIAASDAHFNKIKADAQREVDNAKVNATQRAILQVAANKVIEDADAASAVARLLIEKKFNDARAKLAEAAQAALDSITLDPQSKELAAINKHYADLTATIKKGGLLTAKTQTEIDNARIQALEDVNIKFGEKEISEKEKLAIQAIEVDQKYAGKEADVVKAKNLAILNIKLKAAQDDLALLMTNGKTEDDLVVKNAEALIKNLQNQIAGTQNDAGKKKSLFEFLGISPGGAKDIQQYAAAASAAGRITSDFLGGLADATQQAIDSKQKLIDQDNAALNDLQNQLDKEKALRDQGLANNVDTIQKELDAKKAARDADLKSQQDLQKKQNAIKKAQIIADSVAQVSNLITAASEIFAVFAEIPIVGIPLAIAAIALMFGSFAVAKVNAFNAVGAGQSFGEGGMVDGKSHNQGGKKYRSMDGKGGVVELEGGEYVTNKKSTRKYATILEAINNDDLGGMNEDGIREMLSGLGISISAESPRKVVKLIQERNILSHELNMSPGPGSDISGDVKTISRNVTYLADKERGRAERWEDDKYTYEKKGTKTTKTPKK